MPTPTNHAFSNSAHNYNNNNDHPAIAMTPSPVAPRYNDPSVMSANHLRSFMSTPPSRSHSSAQPPVSREQRSQSIGEAQLEGPLLPIDSVQVSQHQLYQQHPQQQRYYPVSNANRGPQGDSSSHGYGEGRYDQHNHHQQQQQQQQPYHNHHQRTQYRSSGTATSSSSVGSSAVEASYRHLIASTQHHQAQQQHQHQQHYQQQRLRPIAPAPASAPANIAHQQTPVQHRSSSHQQQYHQQGNNRPSNVHPSHHNNISPSLHPQFRAKAVCRLTCKSCLADVCMRGMKAILLADSRVELYSTDRPPKGVQLVYDDYRTRNCKCRIRDVACLGCGNTLGYHVTQPCESCLRACNNGHFWMFHSDSVSCTERFVPKTSSSSPSSPSAASSGSDNGRMSRRLRRDSESSADRVSTAARHVGDAQTPDLILRRRATIHEIGHDSNPRLRHYDDMSHGDSAEEEGEEEEGEIEEDDVDDDSEEESEEEEEEEKPQVMLWAALHAQEERYLQQMQQQQFIIQQQQLQIQQRLLQNQQQQQHDPLGEQNLPLSSAATISPPTVGSRYHSLISTAISNASMMLWDEGRSLNQYEQLCR